MRKLIIAISIFHLTLLNAQERITLPQPKFSTVKSELLTATGWMFQPDGKWMSRKNRIPQNASLNEKSIVDLEGFGLGVDNFLYYQFRDLYFNDSTYTILIKKMKSGYYRYPEIMSDWISNNDIEYAIFNKADLEKEFKSIIDGKVNYIDIKPLKIGTIEGVPDNQDLAKLSAHIVEHSKENEPGNHFIFHIAPYKSKNIVQFQIYILHEGFKKFSYVTFIHAGDINIYVMPDNGLFSKCYFETSYEIFNKFIKL